MANSKSNIYPIQLQGAELCLNRYDAEIKQYSGFNKNNSPFVGGCLSNIYKKDVSIDGETFIDKKGDVYSVDTEGVYLNDKKIINYSEHTRFYKKTKLNVPANAVMAISEDVYITVENDISFRFPMEYTETYEISAGYVIHWGNGYSHELAPVNTDSRVVYDIVRKGNTVVATCKRGRAIKPSWSANTYYDYLYAVIIPDVNEDVCEYWHPARSFSGSYGFFGISQHIGYMAATYITDNEIIIAENNNENQRGSGIYIFNLDGSKRGSQKITRFTYTGTERNDVPPNYLGCWYMTNNGKFYFYTLKNYVEDGQSYLSDFTFNSNLPTHATFYYAAVLDHIDNTDIYLTPKSYFFLNSPAGRVVNGNYTNVNSINNLTPYFPFFNLVLRYKNDTDGGYCFSACGELQNFTVGRDSAAGNTGTISVKEQNGVYFFGDFKVLVNNGEISNISVVEYTDAGRFPEPYDGGSLNGVILEDWNTISNLLITEDGQKAVYKKADGFYAIERTATPKFSLKFNQLVINCNNEYNSINIDTGEILHFGTDWNASYLVQPGYGGVTFGRTEIAGLLYNYSNPISIASSVNEYALDKNASILINPETKYFYNYTTSLSDDIKATFANPNTLYASVLCRDFIKNGVVNYYAGNDATSVNYICSGNFSTEHSEPLNGLPFPTDTNGNLLMNAPLFSNFISTFSNDVFVRIDNDAYALHKSNNQLIMSYYLATLVEGLETLFILQGQYYGIINQQLFSIQMSGGVVVDMVAIVSVQGLQFVGNTPYEALFFSKTNRCLYSFTGANVLNQKQLVDKISEVRNYLYNPATQTVFLITDIGVLFYGLFGIYLLEYEDITQVYLLLDGVVLGNDSGNYHYIKYYLEEGDTDYTKENINVETSFYGMNNEVVTINDCLYFRIFSEEHEEGDLKVSATTISLSGRKTEETTFKIKASDWDKITHTIYLRYQPKTQRGLGVAFAIDSPFKIASLSVGSQPDAVLVDKVSKGAITAPSVTTNNNEW